MARFARASISLAGLVAITAAAQAADLSVTPIYQTRPSIEQATTWRGFYLGGAGSAVAGKSQDRAPRSAADNTATSALPSGLTAGAHGRSGVLVYGVAGE
ncbi:MAG: hypothetical protein QOF09_345 [Alphaproteobacteria bacterium]|jgi:hypothetical protein|nr:hypothetical protein [Alphaproteobacteria bacterium]